MSIADGDKILDECACPACGSGDCYDSDDDDDGEGNVTRRWWCEECGAECVLKLDVVTTVLLCERTNP